MALYPYPDVPALPGVPALPRSPQFPPSTTVGLGLLVDLVSTILEARTQWGIYDQAGNALGNPSQFIGIPADLLSLVGVGSVLSTNAVAYRKGTRVSDFPVERGDFAAYNKVEIPAEPIVTFCFDGSESDRTSFLNSIDAATKSTDLYNLVTPEVTYIGYTLEDYRYERRSNRGATLLLVEIDLVEIRQVSAIYAMSVINDPKNSGATPAGSNGVVQPQAATTSVLQSAGSALKGLAGDVATQIQQSVQ